MITVGTRDAGTPAGPVGAEGCWMITTVTRDPRSAGCRVREAGCPAREEEHR